MPVTLDKKPLLECTLSEVDGVTSEHWCWTIAHLEERMQTVRMLMEHDPAQTPAVLHQHHHGEKCNERCMLLHVVVAP